MSVTKNSAVGKSDVLLAHGAHDTKIGNEDRQYDGISLAAIAAMVAEPQAKEKSDASFIIPSTYREHDGRKHASQRERGQFHYLALDIDEGSPSLVDVKAAVVSVTGDAVAMIYSSSGASEDNRKWRVLIPLAEPVSGADYSDTQTALFDIMRTEHNIKCDPALARPGQPIYLPNVPPAKRDDFGQPMFYHQDRHRGEGFFNVADSRVWENVQFRRQQAEIAERQAAHERAVKQAERIARREASGDDLDPVAEFNARHSVEDMLLRCGYTRDGNSQSYASRYQSSGSFATKNFGEYFVSLSGSDVAAAIGSVKESFCWGDAFDLFCHYDHAGSMRDAVREYAKELRPSPFEEVRHAQPEVTQGDDYDDFDYEPEDDTPVRLEPATVDAGDTLQTWPTPVAQFNEADLPKRRWIYGNHYCRGFVSVTASAGGIGKTSLTMVEALAVATGRPLLGEKVHEQCNVWFICLEDPMDELKLRLAAIMREYNVTHDEIRGKFFMDAEDTINITLAMETRDGLIENTPLANAMRDKIIENNIGLVISDPFISMHAVNENSNPSIQAVVAMVRRITRETGCAFGMIHHIRKTGGEDATIDSVRGAGALIGAARSARVLNKVGKEDAADLGVNEIDAMGLFRVDEGKGNLRPLESAVYRRMKSVKLDNGESIGVAVAYSLPDLWDGMTTRVVNNMLTEIDKGIDGERYSSRPQDKARYVGSVISGYTFANPDHKKSARQAKLIVAEWFEKDLLEEVAYRSEGQRKDRMGVQATGRVGEQDT
jgi:hypothetical protein